MELNLGNILSLVGIFFGASALIATFLLHFIRSERQRIIIETNLKNFNKNSDEILENSRKILHEATQISDAAHRLRPELSTYLAHQWKFIEKTFYNRFEKHDICKRIVSSWIEDDHSILLDSGSSVDLVTYELLSSPIKDVTVYSNNVFAAIHLIGIREITFNMCAGVFNDKFAATYSREYNNRINEWSIKTFILAATAIRFDGGIMVNKKDKDNADFKRAALEAFKSKETSRLIIAVDATKFIEPTVRHQPVVAREEWSELVKSHSSRIILVTAPMRLDGDPAKVSEFKQEVKKFEDAGINVDM
jgi:DeoR/GlpR family transcriptional regulator of sugar metabolism